ncbi:E3 ubiquitin-protein ligase RAD18-like isoform X2 [Leptopilina heterotoma]|uniref:E3 ubiquitin-protein ligase RAD18-like isoform X2 n=1 Tax=Leptopilina heterotoma TaxID=63436 RepID=UPI001CA86B3D|nr:E3 ubiquitin-protein ligase RAD18-like isoform X2 [Leptopilina heterotoma]
MDNSVENSENLWPEEFAELKTIEESLTCGICYEYMQTAVMTPCSHNYCTLCIRRYLNFKNECPACFNQVHDTDLRVNRSLDNIKQSFLKVRENLKLCMKGLPTRPSLERRGTTENLSPVKSRLNQVMSTPKSICKSPSNFRNEDATTPVRANRINQMGAASPQTPSKIDSTAHGENIEKHLFSPGTSGIAPIFNNPVRFKIVGKKENIGPTVPCPVCSVNVSETHINRHLDDCLKRQNNTSGPVSLEPKLKQIPKLVLNLMKDSELRRRLKDFGCSTVGDSKALKGRLNRFYILYNAERDKTVQRPIAEIVKQCEDEEKMETKAVLPTTGNVLTFSKPIVVKPVKGQNENYCEANKSSFNKLIEQVRKRNPRKKKVTSEEEKNELSSLYEDLVAETVANVSNDSDSGTSGHQQRYSNDGQTITESDSNIENDKIINLVDEDDTNYEEKNNLQADMQFSSLLDDSSNDSESNTVLNLYVNKQIAANLNDEISNNVRRNFINSPEKSDNSARKIFKKPRISKPCVENNIQEIDRLLESIDNDEELKDISLNMTSESVESNTIAENEENLNDSEMNEKEMKMNLDISTKQIESDINNEEEYESEIDKSYDENFLNKKASDKENEPNNEDVDNVFHRPLRKRGRPRKYSPSEENTPTKLNRHLENAYNETAIYQVALDGSIDEVVSSPEKILKRRKRKAHNSTESESEPETPTRILRRRHIQTPTKN